MNFDKLSFPEKVVHGDKIRAYRKRDITCFIDFSANLNPFPPLFEWNPDISLANSYPDDTYQELKECAARVFNRNSDEICVGNGSVEIIRTFCYSFLSPGDRVYIEPHTFGEYSLSSRLAGGIPTSDPLRYSLRFLCNPNNPTGDLLARDQILSLISDAEKKDAMFFLDEAFIDLADPTQSVVDVKRENLFVIRSLTKSFAVPGLRIGFGFGDPDIIEKVEVTRPPWTVNSFAENFALYALRNYHRLSQARSSLNSEKEWLYRQFGLIGIDYRESAANFILLNLHSSAAEMVEKLIKYGILVRDCRSFGLPEQIRVAVRSRDENKLLVEALSQCLP